MSAPDMGGVMFEHFRKRNEKNNKKQQKNISLLMDKRLVRELCVLFYYQLPMPYIYLQPFLLPRLILHVTNWINTNIVCVLSLIKLSIT